MQKKKNDVDLKLENAEQECGLLLLTYETS